jgi:multiple sugar transport system permease protein
MTLHKNYGNKKVVVLQNAVNVFLLLLFAIATLFPIYFMITSSFGDPIEAGAVNYALIPQKITLASYEFFFNYSRHSYKWIFNSLVVSSALTVSNVLFAGLAGYAFAKVRFFGRRNLFFIFLCSLMIPYQVVQVPLYILVVNVFQVANTYLALIMPGFCSVYNIFLAKQFMLTLPSEIIECAKIEGCNQLQIYFRIIFPLSKTVLAVMAIMTFMNNWNSFFWPFLVTNTMDMQTIQVGLKNFRFANTTYFSPMMAGATVSALPMFILFFSLQKYFLEGVTVGAVKG